MGSSDLDSAARSLQAGQTLLAQGQAEAALPLLLAARDDAAQGDADTRLQAHNLIERHGLPGAFSAWMGVCCEISPRDDIYRFFDGHPTSVNPLRDYFADGWRTMSELMLLLESVQRPLLGAGSFLEFASGHGRFTRHLVKALGAQRVTVSDVVSDAVAFAQQAQGGAAVLAVLLAGKTRMACPYYRLVLGALLAGSAWAFRWALFMSVQGVPKFGAGLYLYTMPLGGDGLLGILGMAGLCVALVGLISWALELFPARQHPMAAI